MTKFKDMELNNKTRIKLLVAIITLCIISILTCTHFIDTYIENYIKELKPVTYVTVNVINKTDDIVNIEYVNNDTINVYVEKNKNNKDSDKSFDAEVISKRGLNIRKDHTTKSESLGLLQYGEIIKISYTEGQWCKIANDEGWVFKDYIVQLK